MSGPAHFLMPGPRLTRDRVTPTAMLTANSKPIRHSRFIAWAGFAPAISPPVILMAARVPAAAAT